MPVIDKESFEIVKTLRRNVLLFFGLFFLGIVLLSQLEVQGYAFLIYIFVLVAVFGKFNSELYTKLSGVTCQKSGRLVYKTGFDLFRSVEKDD